VFPDLLQVGLSVKGFKMRLIYQIFPPLVGIFFNRVDLTDLWPLHLKAKIILVRDGDSLVVKVGHYQFKTRLLYIDAPEIGQPFIHYSLDAGQISRQCLKTLLKDSSEQVVVARGFDLYHRLLIELDKNHLEIVRRGCAGLSPYARFDSKYEKWTFLRAHQKAQAQRLGLWQWGGYLRPDLYRKINKQILRQNSRR
jgi:endonuclease YncB( thermonuclease family)